MKKIYSFLTLAAVGLFTSCTSIPQSAENLNQLQIGMSKSEVLDLMGEPLKEEIYHQSNIWFYHTDNKWFDGSVTKDECTPIIFDDIDTVSGWGYDFYKKNFLFK